jgi:hypothetical protein
MHNFQKIDFKHYITKAAQSMGNKINTSYTLLISSTFLGDGGHTMSR